MRFKDETVICETCGAEISEDNNFSEDTTICGGCSAVEYQCFLASPCKICQKPMSEDTTDVWYNCDSDYAHGKCIETLTPQQLEDDEWSNDCP